MARYGNEFKVLAVARLLPPESTPIPRLSQEIGVSAATLERWMSDALSRPAPERAWTAAARLEAVIATAAIDETQRSRKKRGRVRRRHGMTVGGSRSWSGICGARRRRSPRQPPCWCCQNNSRRSSNQAGTNDFPGRSPKDCSHDWASAS